MDAPFFDNFCKVAESEMPDEIKNILADAKLFCFDRQAQDFVSRVLTQEMADEFVLPFPVVAVEDPINLVVIADLENGEDRIGMGAHRVFLIFEMTTKNQWADFGGGAVIGIMRTKGAGPITDTRSDLGELLFAQFFIIALGSDDKKEITPDMPEWKECAEKLGWSALTALHELIYALQPKNFILEMEPKRVRQPKAGKFPRSHERVLYTILNPGEIRKKIGLNQPGPGGAGAGGTKAPHERRGFWRTYRDDRYKKMRGKKQWIEPVWIGPSESKVGNKKYKVRLDL
jgi:hypothetical protein